MRCMACGEIMRLTQAVADQSMAVPGFEQHLFRCPGCNDTEQRLVFVHPDDAAPRRIEPIGEADLPGVTLQPTAQSNPGEHDAPPVAPAAAAASQPEPKPDPKRPPTPWQQSVEKHRSRWTALCERLGLQIATEAFTRKD
jgi:hypothetical protein